MVANAYGVVGAEQALTPTAVQTAAYTAAMGDLVVCDITAASFTVKLPASAADKSKVGVKVAATAAGKTLTVSCSGSDRINAAGGASTATLSLAGQGETYQYSASAGLWYVVDDSIPLSELALTDWANVKSYGAKGNGSADDTAAIQAAITANPSGTVFVPKGTYIISAPLTGMASSFRMTGDAASILKSTTCTIIDLGTASIGAVELDHLTLDVTGGHAVTMPRMSRGRFHDLTITQRSPDYSIWDSSNGQGVLECVWEKITASTSVASRTVPAWNFQVPGGNDLLNANVFAELVVNNNGADTAQPIFSLGCSYATGTFQDNTLRNITAENPLGGIVKVRSGCQTSLSNVRAWDLSAAPSNPMFDIGTDPAAGVGPVATALRDCGRSYGPIGAATPPDILLDSSTSQTLISNYSVTNKGATADKPYIDLGGSQATVIEGAPAGLSLAGTQGASWSVTGPSAPAYTDSSGTAYTMQTGSGGSTASNTTAAGEVVNWASVKSYGAKGDGVTDDTASIQSAVNAATSGAGLVYLSAGTYVLSAAIVVNSGITLAGDGIGVTILKQSSTTADGIDGVDVEFVTIRDLTVQGPGGGSGNGIKLSRAADPNIPYINLARVHATAFGNCGITADVLIVSRLDSCVAGKCGGDGFQLTSQAGNTTSVSFTSCYAQGNGGTGYELNSAVYCSLTACAADNNGWGGYALYSCQAVTLASCGSEANSGAANVTLSGGKGNTVAGLWVNVNSTVGVDVTAAETNATLTGCIEYSASGATSWITTDAGTSAAIVNCPGTTANSLAGNDSGAPSDPQAADFRYLAWAYDPIAAGNSLAPNAGAAYASLIPVRRAITASKVVYGVVSTSSIALTSGECFAALYDSAGQQVAVTADITAQIVTGEVAFAFTSPVVLAPGNYYAVLLLNGTTLPTIARGEGVINNLGSGQAGFRRFGTIGTGLTALPASYSSMGAVTSNTYWAALA